MPIAWSHLPALKSSAQWTIIIGRDLLLAACQSDPWAGHRKTRQTLTAAMKTLDLQPTAGARRSAV